VVFCSKIKVIVRKGGVRVENVELRVKKGSISSRVIAKHMGIHENTVYNWLNDASLDEVKKQRLLIAINEIKEGN